MDENIKDRWREYFDELFYGGQGHAVGGHNNRSFR